MNKTLKKFKILSKPFWSYKDISVFYELSFTKAIQLKKKSIEINDFSKNRKGIYQHNTDLVNSDWVIKLKENKNRLQKIEEYSQKFEIILKLKGEIYVRK